MCALHSYCAVAVADAVVSGITVHVSFQCMQCGCHCQCMQRMKYTLSVHAGVMVHVMRSTCAEHAGILCMQISKTDAQDVRSDAANQNALFSGTERL